MSCNISVIECPNDSEHRVEPIVHGKGYSEWVCLDCGEQFKELYSSRGGITMSRLGGMLLGISAICIMVVTILVMTPYLLYRKWIKATILIIEGG